MLRELLGRSPRRIIRWGCGARTSIVGDVGQLLRWPSGMKSLQRVAQEHESLVLSSWFPVVSSTCVTHELIIHLRVVLVTWKPLSVSSKEAWSLGAHRRGYCGRPSACLVPAFAGRVLPLIESDPIFGWCGYEM